MLITEISESFRKIIIDIAGERRRLLMKNIYRINWNKSIHSCLGVEGNGTLGSSIFRIGFGFSIYFRQI